MDKFLQNKFDRLRQFTQSLALAMKDDLPNMSQTLDSNEPLLKNCPSRESMALKEFSRIEKKLQEVTAAAAAIREILARRHQAKKSRRTS